VTAAVASSFGGLIIGARAVDGEQLSGVIRVNSTGGKPNRRPPLHRIKDFALEFHAVCGPELRNGSAATLCF
jgi:hypothetical protein